MRKLVIAVVIGMTGCAPKETTTATVEQVTTIAFGSCGHQNDPQPVIDQVALLKPDLFIYLGDNIYSDTYSMDTLRENYRILAARPEFQRLKGATKLMATWDDHDFGWNDSGRHYPFKAESKEIFLDFFPVEDSAIHTHPGIYHSRIFKGDKTLQIIMLDLRTFRDKLLPHKSYRAGDPRFDYGLDYDPYDSTNTDSTMLGEAQWAWLEDQLRTPADLRIIGSSTQFGITYNGYEAWANFPHEQKRMLDLIRKTRASGVLFISGDVHYAEVSRLMRAGLYPIYDVTSSGITSRWDFATPNDNRIDGPVMENHFGLLMIDWNGEDPMITMQIRDVTGKTRIDRSIRLSEIQFR
ncbi:MAG TPA: alkaline phosphatase D family protein [Chryseosolibacter sp.]|nr:alkaline phosphatase D family protein [Chryseosolibacter sp.]